MCFGALPSRWLVVSAVALATALTAASRAPAQQPPVTPGWEYKAVAFGKDAEEATKKLGELAAEGWEYAGPLSNHLVAFKRPRGHADARQRVKDIDAEIADRLDHIDSRMRHLAKVEWVKEEGVSKENRKSTNFATQSLKVPIDELDRSFGAVSELKERSMLSLLSELALLVPKDQAVQVERARQMVIEMRRYSTSVPQDMSVEQIQTRLAETGSKLRQLESVRWNQGKK